MNTNDIVTVAKVADDAVSVVMDMKPGAFTIVACIAFGFVLKIVLKLFPSINRNIIPALILTIVGPFVYCYASHTDWDSWANLNYPVIKEIMVGWILGAASWGIHNKFIKDTWIEKLIIGGNGDTKELPANSHL